MNRKTFSYEYATAASSLPPAPFLGRGWRPKAPGVVLLAWAATWDIVRRALPFRYCHVNIPRPKARKTKDLKGTLREGFTAHRNVHASCARLFPYNKQTSSLVQVSQLLYDEIYRGDFVKKWKGGHIIRVVNVVVDKYTIALAQRYGRRKAGAKVAG